MGEDHSPGQHPNEDEIVVLGGPCKVCGRQTSHVSMSSIEEARGEEEPAICNRCLLDLRGTMATELEVRRQLSNLEAKVEGYAWKQWILYFAFTLAFGALTFLAGLWLGG